MKNECIDRHFPLIHLQKEPIGPYWKPEKKRFDACAQGTLLILAPWNLEDMGAVGEALLTATIATSIISTRWQPSYAPLTAMPR